MIAFFKIDQNTLSIGSKYSFPIYSYCEKKDKREVLLHVNKVLSSGKLAELKKENELQIYFKDIKKYLREAGVAYDDFISLNEKRVDYVFLNESRETSNNNESFVKKLSGSMDKNEKNNRFFKSLRIEVVKEVLSYDVSESDIVNTVICLVEKVFTRDFKSVKIAAISFLIAKKLNILEKAHLSNILLLALFKNIGRLSNPMYKNVKDISELMDTEKIVVKNSIDFFEEHDEPMFNHIVEELEKIHMVNDELYRKIHEIIISAELLCYCLDNDKVYLDRKEKIFELTDYQFKYANEIKIHMSELAI